MRLALIKTERADVYSGKINAISRPVIAANSTVLGRAANAEHDARAWCDGWINLGINDPRTYSDGMPYKIKGMPNPFGHGRNGTLSCGEYLHCPVVDDGEENRFYRVRSRIEPGDVLHFGKIVKTTCTSVGARKMDGIWHWVYEFNRVIKKY